MSCDGLRLFRTKIVELTRFCAKKRFAMSCILGRSDGYADAAGMLELISSQVPTMREESNFSQLVTRLECCWVRLQSLIESDINLQPYQKCSLQEAQAMLGACILDASNPKQSHIYSRKESESSSNLQANNHSEDMQSSIRTSAIEETILKPGTISFDEIAGLLDAKRLLKEAIVLPLQYPHLFTNKRKPWRSILLYGPPGTGKSRMAEAVSSEIESTFYSVSSSDLLSSWFGESEKLIKELFQHARRTPGRAIIFIDEIDSLCRKRDSREAETTRRVKTELLKQLEGASSKSHDRGNVFILGATNCPWELDSAFLRRFEKRIYISLPDREARKDLFKIHLGDAHVTLSNAEWDRILDRTSGFSGSDLATCISDALLEPIRELSESSLWKWSEDKKWLTPCEQGALGAIKLRLQSIPREKVQPRALLFKDLVRSLDANHRTVSTEDLDKYTQFTQSFGQVG